MSELPTADVIVDWYQHPYKAQRAETPRRKYNSPTKSLSDSIDLTLQFLAAASPPFDHGRPHLIEGHNKKPTLFWSVYEIRSEEKIKENGTTRTVTTIRYYGFDASGLLAVETVVSESYEDKYQNRYSWPFESKVPKGHITMLKWKLKEFRKSLVVN